MSHQETLIVLLSYALQSGLLLTVGLIAPRLLRLRHPRTLLVYWRILLPVVILLPLATAIWQPKHPLPMLSIDSTAVEEVVAIHSEVPIWSNFSWGLLLVPVLLVTALGLTPNRRRPRCTSRRCRRTATPIIPLPDRVSALQRRLGLEVPFAATDRLSVPITFGWARPIVMVPMSFNRLSVDEQEGVACHELLHIHRRDWPVALAEEIVRAILWFHPAVWFLLPRIALSREQVVDAGTVEMTGKRRQYLDALWQIVVSSHKPAAAIAVPLVGRSHLRARVESSEKGDCHVENPDHRQRGGPRRIGRRGRDGRCDGLFLGPSRLERRTRSGATWSTEDEKPTGDDKEDRGKRLKKLETWDHDGECSEMTHPEAIEKVNPTYPPEAREAKIMGKVILRSTINDDGQESRTSRSWNHRTSC